MEGAEGASGVDEKEETAPPAAPSHHGGANTSAAMASVTAPEADPAPLPASSAANDGVDSSAPTRVVPPASPPPLLQPRSHAVVEIASAADVLNTDGYATTRLSPHRITFASKGDATPPAPSLHDGGPSSSTATAVATHTMPAATTCCSPHFPPSPATLPHPNTGEDVVNNPNSGSSNTTATHVAPPPPPRNHLGNPSVEAKADTHASPTPTPTPSSRHRVNDPITASGSLVRTRSLPVLSDAAKAIERTKTKEDAGADLKLREKNVQEGEEALKCLENLEYQREAHMMKKREDALRHRYEALIKAEEELSQLEEKFDKTIMKKREDAAKHRHETLIRMEKELSQLEEKFDKTMVKKREDAAKHRYEALIRMEEELSQLEEKFDKTMVKKCEDAAKHRHEALIKMEKELLQLGEKFDKAMVKKHEDTAKHSYDALIKVEEGLSQLEDKLDKAMMTARQQRDARMKTREDAVNHLQEVLMMAEELTQREEALDKEEEELIAREREVQARSVQRREQEMNNRRRAVQHWEDTEANLRRALLEQQRQPEDKDDNVWNKRQTYSVLALGASLTLLVQTQPLMPADYVYLIVGAFAVVWIAGYVAIPFGLFGTHKLEKEFSRHAARLTFMCFSIFVVYAFYLLSYPVLAADGTASHASPPPSPPPKTALDIRAVFYTALAICAVVAQTAAWVTACKTRSDQD